MHFCFTHKPIFSVVVVNWKALTKSSYVHTCPCRPACFLRNEYCFGWIFCCCWPFLGWLLVFLLRSRLIDGIVSTWTDQTAFLVFHHKRMFAPAFVSRVRRSIKCCNHRFGFGFCLSIRQWSAAEARVRMNTMSQESKNSNSNYGRSRST